MILHPVQDDRHMCEVPGCENLGTDWDHCIFKKNNRKPRYKKFTYNPFNYLRACAICNRITHETDKWYVKEWLIDKHLNSKYKEEFLEWIKNPPHKLQVDYMINSYLEKRRMK